MNDEGKTMEQLKAEAKATAICSLCKKLLKDCLCMVSEEAAEKFKKLCKIEEPKQVM